MWQRAAANLPDCCDLNNAVAVDKRPGGTFAFRRKKHRTLNVNIEWTNPVPRSHLQLPGFRRVAITFEPVVSISSSFRGIDCHAAR
jgi:hypothetical protein